MKHRTDVERTKDGVRLRSRALQRRYNLMGFLFASPWIIGFLCFTIIPIVLALYYSFTNYNLFNKCDWVGLKNYADMFKDKYIWKSLWNTFYVTIIGTPLAQIVALILALLLNQKKVKGLPVFRTLFYLPTLVPVVASSMLFMWVLNGNYGLLNTLLGYFGIEGPYWLTDPKFTKISLIMMDTWRCGTVMIFYLAALRAVPESLYEAAELDGAGPIRRFFSITLPYISPTIQFQVIMAMISNFQYFTQAYVFASLTDAASGAGAGGGPSNSMLFYCLYLYRKAFAQYKMGYACAMAVLLAVIVMVSTALVMHFSEKSVNYDTE